MELYNYTEDQHVEVEVMPIHAKVWWNYKCIAILSPFVFKNSAPC